VLSTFTGAGLLDRGFREEGFCCVSAGDALLGQPIEEFHAVKGHFFGIIGGPPCQKDSIANRTNRDPLAGMELKKEFFRVVSESEPEWFLMEGVNGLPLAAVSELVPSGYTLQRMHLNARELGFAQHRERWYLFGYRRGNRS
jgi:DNA (cytosine-5)-methyltransferase 1